MMRLAGFPVAGKVGKECNPAYCGNGNSIKATIEQLKERIF